MTNRAVENLALLDAETERLLATCVELTDARRRSLCAGWDVAHVLTHVARNADAPTWDVLHRIAAGTRGAVERSTYYQLLGFAKDDALARRALDLSITKEPGATVSAAIITAAAENHPVMAFDFVLSHLPQVDPLIDLSASSRFVSRLVQNSGDAAVTTAVQSARRRRPSTAVKNKISAGTEAVAASALQIASPRGAAAPTPRPRSDAVESFESAM